MLKDYDINKKGRKKFGFLTKCHVCYYFLVGMRINLLAVLNNILLTLQYYLIFL